MSNHIKELGMWEESKLSMFSLGEGLYPLLLVQQVLRYTRQKTEDTGAQEEAISLKSHGDEQEVKKLMTRLQFHTASDTLAPPIPENYN